MRSQALGEVHKTQYMPGDGSSNRANGRPARARPAARRACGDPARQGGRVNSPAPLGSGQVVRQLTDSGSANRRFESYLPSQTPHSLRACHRDGGSPHPRHFDAMGRSGLPQEAGGPGGIAWLTVPGAARPTTDNCLTRRMLASCRPSAFAISPRTPPSVIQGVRIVRPSRPCDPQWQARGRPHPDQRGCPRGLLDPHPGAGLHGRRRPPCSDLGAEASAERPP